MFPFRNGYPDPTYLDALEKELKALGFEQSSQVPSPYVIPKRREVADPGQAAHNELYVSTASDSSKPQESEDDDQQLSRLYPQTNRKEALDYESLERPNPLDTLKARKVVA